MNKTTAYSCYDNKTYVAEQYAPLVKKIAHHLIARLPASVQLDDLIQAGMMGLLEASSKFDNSKGAKFETFAGIRIRGSMLDEIRKGDWVPRSVHRNQRRVAEAIDDLEQELGRNAKDTEIAQRLEVSLSDYYQMLGDITAGKILGIDDLDGSSDFLSKDSQISNDNFEQLVQVKFKDALVNGIKLLPERDALVLSLYYDEELNLKEIGAILEVSESRISQILNQAMIRLKAKLKHWIQV